MFSAKHSKKSVGEFGEKLAYKYLKKLGWNILIKNYRRKSDEIDLIGISKENVLVFVEVKTLLNFNDKDIKYLLIPEDNMSENKYRKIARTAEFFSRRYPQYVDPEVGWRIDLIAIQIEVSRRVAQLRHYKNI